LIEEKHPKISAEQNFGHLMMRAPSAACVKFGSMKCASNAKVHLLGRLWARKIIMFNVLVF
jgi:hypothetical protein